jgi:polysaccharide export outer membrane protein
MTAMKRLFTLWISIVLVPWLCLAGQKPINVSSKPVTAIERAEPEYIIGPNDVLEIAVWNNEALSRTVPVRPDGKISLQLVNDVQAAGLTPMQLRTSLASTLAGFLQGPEVSIIVREVHSYKVSVMGEVKEPGRFDLTGRVTVLDVLAMAKGFTEYADKGNISVFRRERGVTRMIPFEYQKLVAGRESNTGRENFIIQPDDVVLVR